MNVKYKKTYIFLNRQTVHTERLCNNSGAHTRYSGLKHQRLEFHWNVDFVNIFADRIEIEIISIDIQRWKN